MKTKFNLKSGIGSWAEKVVEQDKIWIRSADYLIELCQFPVLKMVQWLNKMLPFVEAEWRVYGYMLFAFSFLISLINVSQSVSSVAQSCPTLCDPMNHSTPGHPVHHQLLEFTQTHIHRVSDAIQPCHPLSSPFPPAPNPSQHQGLFQWVNSSHEVAKVLEFQL